jgi:hypothetical protein
LVDIESEEALHNELVKMADFILQVYKTIADYRQNKYPAYEFKEGLRIYPLVVTLEDWLAFGPKILGSVHQKVVQRFEKEGMPPVWLDEMPYSFVQSKSSKNFYR